MLCSAIENYIKIAKGLPFFYAIGDEAYCATLDELKQYGFQVDRISDFCYDAEKYPDLGEVIDYFRTLDVDCNTNKHVLIGLGEYLALRGKDCAEKELYRLKDTTLGSARVILLLRGVTSQISSMLRNDGRLAAQNRVTIDKNASSLLSVTCIQHPIGKDTVNGLKGLLRFFEDGGKGNCYVNTELEFPDSLISISYINTAYAVIKMYNNEINVGKEFGTEEEWDHLAKELSDNDNSLAAVFKIYGFSDDLEANLYKNCIGSSFKNWLFFLYLKQNINNIKNAYLHYIVSKTNNFKELKDNILKGIIEIPRTEPQFKLFYEGRKELIKNFITNGFPEADMHPFIIENNVDSEESIYRFTDCTQVEREEIIKWISGNGYITEIDEIYPDLGYYLKDYIFDCGKGSSKFTDYFKEYKLQKVKNCISPEFLEKVLCNAENFLDIYTQITETRDNLIQKIEDKNEAYLYWIDALGVEYLAFITELARQKGLSIHIDITYSNIPTLTCFNKGFYDNWTYPLKMKDSRLDEIKHKDKGGFNFKKCDAPIHIAAELETIRQAIDRADMELRHNNCKSFVIVSDHGASRLAVIHRQEEKYETDTKGEHSGRCCKEFKDSDLEYAVRDNGYLVLANYGRFKGSRAANVEVHGGATLEELLVPVITLTIKKDQRTPLIKIPHADAIFTNRREGTTFELYISYVEHKDKVRVVIDGVSYTAKPIDSSHFLINLPGIKRAKKNVVADIYDDENLLGNISFEIKGRTAIIESDFGFLD